MADPQPLTLRPIPSLAEWLGDGSRTEGFEDWVRTMLATEEVVGTPQEATCAKILRALSIACVEGATRQVNEGADAGDVIILTARMAGVACMSMALSALDDAARPHFKELCRTLVAEFRAGAQLMTRHA